MGNHDKLIQRLRGKPKDFIGNELQRLLAAFGHEPGDGSRKKFINRKKGVVISMHQPHPGNELKRYRVRELLLHFKEARYV